MTVEGTSAGASIAQNISTPAESPAAAPTEQAPSEPVSGEGEAFSEPTQPTEPSQHDLDFTRRFNALSRREREILQREQQFKDQYGQYESYQKERELLKSNPVEFLEKNGWKFNELADYVLNDQKPTADRQVSELQKRIDQLENERKMEIEQRQKAEQDQKNQAQITQFKENMKAQITGKDDYELVNHFGEYDLVYDVIENYFNQYKTILPVDKAAAEVENYLEKQFTRAAETNKFKKRFNLANELANPGESQQPGQSEPAPSFPPRTLTNDSVANTQPASTQPTEHYLSDEESKRRSAQLLQDHFRKKQGYTRQ